ncbi:MAG: glycosyltransferase family 4 protein [Acidobacteriia bacterium]|nr:glycosyltransferase family 4 protein [Terriglobia bacterium]
MQVLILNQAFYPDVVSTAQHAADLARALTQADHEVTVICNSRGYDDPKLRFPNQETWNRIRIIRVRSSGFGKSAKWRRAADIGSFMASCAYHLRSLPRFDVVVAMTSPPLISFVASLALPRRARSLVFWSMDLNPDEAIAAGWLQPNSLLASVLSRMLLHSLHRADRIIALDRFMKERIEAKGVDANKILVVPPWSLDDSVRFDRAGREEFRTTHNLSRKFVVMYSGNHSPCHPLETLLQAAERLSENEDVAFCFVGGGSEFGKVKERARIRGLRNVLCLPYQPIEKLSGSLSAADLHVVVMGEQYVGIVHPCKIYNVLAVKKPFLYIGPNESHVTDIIRQSSAYVSSHGDVEGVIANILRAARSNLLDSPRGVEVETLFSKNRLVPQMVRAIEQSGSEYVNIH